MPYLHTDCQAIGEMAADYFLERGFRYFAYCGFHGQSWSLKRQRAFVQRIGQAGFQTDCFEQMTLPGSNTWQQEIKQIAQWIQLLPKPLALMACNDDRAFDVIEACVKPAATCPKRLRCWAWTMRNRPVK